MEGLKPYPAYKDSGLEWLGKVPAHWEIQPLKRLLANVVDTMARPEEGADAIALENVESWTGRVMQPETASLFDSKLNRFVPGDILFGKLRPYLAKVARPKQGGSCVGEFFVLRPRGEKTQATYFEQLLRSKPIIDAVSGSTFGARMPRADWGFMGRMPVVNPPVSEQSAIARFLDHATSRIDRYIRAKEKLIALLEEQKQVVIQDAVTGRIDVRTGKPYSAYRDSGVEWLGDVPEHWDVSALRLRFSQCLGKMLDTSRIKGDHLIPYLRNVDVQWDQINVNDLPMMDVAPAEHERYTVRQGDLLVCEGGDVGRSAIWVNELQVCAFQKALHRIRPRDAGRDLVRFLYYALRLASQQSAFNDGHVSTIAHLTGEKLRAHRFPFPPTSEQSAIVDFLESEVAQSKRSLDCIRRQIELGREYRSRLIADVVTGKLDVREAAATLPDVNSECERVAASAVRW